jgi:hypothetical protein
MTLTVTQLITQAYYDSSVVSRQFETVQGYQLSDGLLWLNELLGDKAMDNGDIPYLTQQYPFTGVVGQEKYFIPNLISIDALVFYIGAGTGGTGLNTVRYQMNFIDRVRYFGAPRANGINALPVSYTYERVLGGANIWVYFPPQQPYLFNITGNFFISNVSLNQDLQSSITTANLGVPTIVAPGTISTGQLVINGVDLAGTYATTTALVTHINTGVIPYVTASIQNFQFILTSINGTTISIVTNGVLNAPVLGQWTFQFFSLQNGYFSQNFYALAFDQFYTNYLEYQLAERICQKLNFAVPDGVKNQLERYQLQISKMAEPLDLVQQKIKVLGDIRAINYAQANIGQGFSVGSL